MERKYDAFINAINYEKKMTYRHLKEMEERADYTAKNHVSVDMYPFVFMINHYRTRIDTLNQSLRLYRKHALVPKNKKSLGAEQEAENVKSCVE